MKNIGLKFACVFIILIFCLAPLSAIDLNEDNNTKYINQDDNDNAIAVDDVDTVTEDVDNQTVEIDTKDNDSVVEIDEDVEDINETDELDEHFDYDYFSIHVDDITEGNPAVIEVSTYDFISTGVYVHVEGQPFTFLWVDHGHASTTVEGLKPGTYTAHLSVQGSDLTNSTTFTVHEKPDPNLNVEVKDICQGEKAVAEVNIDKAYSGEVSLELDGSLRKTINVENGYGKATFDEDLKSGTHTVVATSSASPDFKKSQKTTTFTVSEYLYLDVVVDDVKQGQPIVVKVNTAKGYNGYAFATLDNVDMKYGDVHDGYYTCTFDSEDLTPGSHEITAYTLSDGDYRGSKKTVEFNVEERLDPELSVDVEDTYLCENAVAKVHIKDNYTGNVVIKMDGSEAKTVSMENGYGQMDFGEVNPGQHTVEVSSSSTPEYAKSQKTASFTANDKLNLDVKVDEVTQGEPVVVEVQTSKKYNGFVVCNLDSGPMEFGYAKDGYYSCSFDGSDLEPGTHKMSANAFHPGSVFAFTSKEITFNVTK